MTAENTGRNLEADVVVIGYGGAGAATAIAAHDSGAKVIILEKMPTGGGNTRVSAGIPTEPKGMGLVRYIETLCAGTTERAMIETFVAGAMENRDWIHTLGAETEPRLPGLDVFYPAIAIPAWPSVAGGELITRFQVKRDDSDRGKPMGDKLWKVLSSAVERRGITVLTGTPAKELVTNQNGEVVGALTEQAGQRISVNARRGVVLTCGGFEYNEAMKLAFLPSHPFYAMGNPGNTGDGIVMAQKVGAALWHMTAVAAPLGFKARENDTAFYLRIPGGRFIFVDDSGNRFVNETGMDVHEMWRDTVHFDTTRFRYPRLPTYIIFDEINRRRGPLKAPGLGTNAGYEWSLDNSAELSMGWITQGKTLRELARKIPLDESSLDKTVDRYNQSCKAGKDTDFSRARESLEPIDKAPYYAMAVWPCLLNTQGGPKRDTKARVLDHMDRPVPRLYSAGELGSLWGFMYEGGGNIAECLAFGRIAGQNAAAEKPW